MARHYLNWGLSRRFGGKPADAGAVAGVGDLVAERQEAVRYRDRLPGPTVLDGYREEWGQVLGDEVMAAAMLDRLLHHAHIVNIRGNSYRLRHREDLVKVFRRRTGEEPASAGTGNA